MLDRTPDYRLKREEFSLELPDGKTLPLPTVSEHREGDTPALQNREKVQRDSINYFPPSATRACALTFFPDLTSRALPVDEVNSATNAPVSVGSISRFLAGSHTASIGSM